MGWHLKWLVVFLINFLSCYGFSEKNINFEKAKIKLGSKTILVELAKTPEQHSHGLMYRSSLPENQGMLFIFNQEETLNFWMKNTYVDLAIAYIDKNKKIVDIQEMKATNPMMIDTPPSYPSLKPAMYALEMNKGWFRKNKIKVGMSFQFVKSSPQQKSSPE